MDDTTEVMRQQLSDTRSQLTEKLVSLEQQVSNTAESTGSAVNATVGAVQETVESVTGAINGAVQSITDAIDLRQQIKHHPWLILGGSMALGYLGVELFEQSAKSSGMSQKSGPPSVSDENDSEHVIQHSPQGFSATPKTINAADDADSNNLLWHQLTTAVTGALVGMV